MSTIELSIISCTSVALTLDSTLPATIVISVSRFTILPSCTSDLSAKICKDSFVLLISKVALANFS